MSLTTDRGDACLYEVLPSGQNKCYLVLSDEELAKGFVRPLRRSYKHVKRVTKLEGADGSIFDNEVPMCGVVTHMGLKLCETYARDPGFYSHTFCTGCGEHLPVQEFVWMEDGAELGS